jgi:hypothetical protein
MGLFDFLFDTDSASNQKDSGWDRSVFDNNRFKNNGSSNWVDWEDVSTGANHTDGYEHPYHDEEGEW